MTFTCKFVQLFTVLKPLKRPLYSLWSYDQLQLALLIDQNAFITRHRASTSMYSLTFCVRVMLQERHQLKPAVQAAAY